MERELAAIALPRKIYRVARLGVDPFTPPPWHLAGEDGTFGNRFDDPSGNDPSRRFHVIYCASTAVGAFGETLAKFRPSPQLLASLRDIADDETLGSQLGDVLDPLDFSRGIVPATWRLRHVLAEAELIELARFVDFADPRPHQYFREEFSSEIIKLKLHDFDLSTATGPHRSLTQLCARHVYDLHDGNGVPLFDGIRYLSRLNSAWECWAIFEKRMTLMPGRVSPIHADNPDLMEVCKLFRLSIETIGSHYVRP